MNEPEREPTVCRKHRSVTPPEIPCPRCERDGLVSELTALRELVDGLRLAGREFLNTVEGSRGDLAMGDPGRCEDRLHAGCERFEARIASLLSGDETKPERLREADRPPHDPPRNREGRTDGH